MAQDTAHIQGAPGSPVTVEAGPRSAAEGSGWNPGRIAALVVGALLVLIALPLVGGGGTALWADQTQRDSGYVTSATHQFAASGSALTTEPTQLGSAGWGWLYSPSMLGNVRIRVTPATAGSKLFVGIAASSDVERYLAGVGHTMITDYFGDKAQVVDGGKPGSIPATQRFWVASTSGSGPRTLFWHPRGGSWTVVVMNADGRPGIDVKTDLGARFTALPWIATGALIAGLIFLAGGVLLVVAAVRGRRANRPVTV